MSDKSGAVLENHSGGFAFVPGLGFASAGVRSLPGQRINGVHFASPLGLEKGYEAIERYLVEAGRPITALCGVDLRSPAATGLEEFFDFNARYLEQLDKWGLLREQASPLTRTNVVPRNSGLTVALVSGFSYTHPADAESESDYVFSGVAELPTGAHYPQHIVRRGDDDAAAVMVKCEAVLSDLKRTAERLEVKLTGATSLNLYTQHKCVVEIRRNAILSGGIGLDALTWHDSCPPLRELELEIDIRRYAAELYV